MKPVKKNHPNLLLFFAFTMLAMCKASVAAPLGDLDVKSVTVDKKKISMMTKKGQRVVIDFINPAVFRIQASNNGKLKNVKDDAVSDQCKDLQCKKSDFKMSELPSIVIKKEQGYVNVSVINKGNHHVIKTSKLSLYVNHKPLKFTLYKADNTLLWKELKPIVLGAKVNARIDKTFKNGKFKTTQVLSSRNNEYFYGGGQQNGQYEFSGKKLDISYTEYWDEFDRPNPAPFYMSDKGYGVLRHTWRNGVHDFRNKNKVVSSYNENRFDAYYFVGESITDIINQYTKLTGRPHLLSRWAYYLGDADCYENKNGSYPDGWPNTPGNTIDVVDQVAVPYKDHNMPVGWILPNDGYGCGYSDLKNTADELDALGIKTGLWTPKALDKMREEVTDGVRVYKLDVAWTGPGKIYALAANKTAHNGLTRNSNTRGMVWTVRGWAGTQRYSVTWTGDQSSSWDYIRWHIPTFIGSGLSGQAYASSDVNGIMGNSSEIYTRDIQFKTFTPVLIAMSGWDDKERKHPWWFADDYKGKMYRDINRKFLMLKSQLMPYMYTYAYQADRTGTPLVRAMTLEFPNDPHLKGEKYKYQYMYGKSLLVAPVYESMEDSKGWRKNIYLPKGTWIDFWDGTRTSAPQGGMVLARYPVTIDKIPVLVKAGAIIPMYQGARSDALQPKDNLIVQLYPHGNSSFTLYEDDGETRAYKHKKAYAETLITATAPLNNETGDINLTINPAIVHHDYDGLVTERKYHFQVLSLVKPLDVTLNSKKVNKANSMADFEAATDAWFYDPTDRKGVIHVKTGKQSVYQYQNLTINIAKNATPTP